MKACAMIHVGKGQLAETAVERLLIALLRVSDGEMLRPEHVLWLSQALEAIVISPVEGLTSSLQKRLIALLGAPPSSKKAKRKINSFYALRSRIAHGDFRFIHPMGNEVIDPEINSIYDEISQAVDFGMAASVAIAQMLVRQRWRAVSFVEEIRGTE